MVYYRFVSWEPLRRQSLCHQHGLEFKVLNHVKEATEQTLQILRNMGIREDVCCGSCRPWISALGTDREDPSQRRLWDQLTFVLGLGMEHLSVRHDGRKVYLSQSKMANV